LRRFVDPLRRDPTASLNVTDLRHCAGDGLVDSSILHFADGAILVRVRPFRRHFNRLYTRVVLIRCYVRSVLGKPHHFVDVVANPKAIGRANVKNTPRIVLVVRRFAPAKDSVAWCVAIDPIDAPWVAWGSVPFKRDTSSLRTEPGSQGCSNSSCQAHPSIDVAQRPLLLGHLRR
jgi:hypothetical protein